MQIAHRVYCTCLAREIRNLKYSTNFQVIYSCFLEFGWTWHFESGFLRGLPTSPYSLGCYRTNFQVWLSPTSGWSLQINYFLLRINSVTFQNHDHWWLSIILSLSLSLWTHFACLRDKCPWASYMRTPLSRQVTSLNCIYCFSWLLNTLDRN